MSDRQHAEDAVHERRRDAEMGIGAWIAFWLQLGVLGVLAIIGALYASGNASGGDYACGLILAVAAVLLMFLRVKGHFDGTRSGIGSFLLVGDMPSLVLVVIIFAVLGLGGIFVAAAVGVGGLYAGGVALFAVSLLAILLSMKRVFDNLDRRP